MGTHLWITARALHRLFRGGGVVMGRPGAYDLADHGIKVMRTARCAIKIRRLVRLR